MVSMMLLTTVLNSSMGCTEVLVTTEIGVFLGTARVRMVIGSGSEGLRQCNWRPREERVYLELPRQW